MAVPTRKTSERELDEFNRQLRSSPLYQQFMRSRGLRTDGHVKLSRKQQSDLERAMARAGFAVPGGMHIDQGGNLNQKNRLIRNVAIGAALTAGTIATLGATGVISGGVLGGFGLGSTAAPVVGGVGAGAGTGAGAGAAAGAGSGLLASSAAPIAYSGLAPTAVMAGTGATSAGVGAAAASSLTGLVTGAGAPTAAGYAGVGGGGSLLASTPLAASGGYAATVPSVTSNVGGGGMTGMNWFEVGKGVWDAGTSLAGNRSANQATDRASEVSRQNTQDLVAFEREKLAEDKRQAELKRQAEERNFAIQQEERMDEMRRLEEREAMAEPIRLAKEQGYRQYMKKYYGLDIGPSVARTPRQFGVTPGKQAATTDIAAPQPLAAQADPGAAYGSIAPAEPDYDISMAGSSVDPWFIKQGQQDPAFQARRSIGQGDY